jgi:EAL domain-containing protein (putative c-di-GMP-specific phosphodiesterase class I)
VLESLRDLAISQNARMIAEGVETSRQLQVLREMHIGAAQGFLLGRPDASVEMTHVDVQQLESGVLVPGDALPVAAMTPALRAEADEAAAVPEDRAAVFLSPARRPLESELGRA